MPRRNAIITDALIDGIIMTKKVFKNPIDRNLK